MTTATQPEEQSAVGSRQSAENRTPESRPAKRLPAHLRNALFAEWAKFSPTVDWECTEREARLRFASEVLVTRHSSPVASWNDLTAGQAKRLLREMKEISGSNAAYRAQIIARLAVELWGGDWDAFLRERLRERFRLSTTDCGLLTPAQAHELIEELLSRIARQEGRKIEELRREIRGRGKF